MSVRAAVGSSRSYNVQTIVSAVSTVSCSDRMRFSQLAMPSHQTEQTGVKARDRKKVNDPPTTRRRPASSINKNTNKSSVDLTMRIQLHLPSKKTLMDAYNAMEYLKKHSRRMTDREKKEGKIPKYIHDDEWNGDGSRSFYASFNYLLSNEQFYKNMLTAYGMDSDNLTNMMFFQVAVALGSIDKFKEMVPDYLEDSEIFSDYSGWPDDN